MTTCPHGKPLHVPCYVCKAEAVHNWARNAVIRSDAIDEELQADVDRLARPRIPHKRGGARAVAIVALRRIVDRAVRDELSSPATADILRIALKALNQLED